MKGADDTGLVVKSLALRATLRTTAATWRVRETVAADCRPILEGNQAAVIAFWHFQMLPLWYALRYLAPAAVVSASRDGELLARYLGSLGYPSVLRGSSSRGGSEVLSAAVAELALRPVLITPDGPRGPARVAKPGAIVAALRAEVPVVVAGWRSDRTLRFRSWDRMEVPLPFARVDIRYERFDVGVPTGDRVVEKDLARLAAALDGVVERAAAAEPG